jgi:hypothetical protein
MGEGILRVRRAKKYQGKSGKTKMSIAKNDTSLR